MRTIYQIDKNKIWTGNFRTITNRQGRPPDYVESDVPPPSGIAQWQNQWVLLDKYPQKTVDELKADVRAQRDSLLTASDWTQVIDAPVDQAAWAVYRQALRDIPQQEGFPATVVWPTQPE